MLLTCLHDKHKSPRATTQTQEDWARLYRAHQGAVYARCRRLLGDRSAAEDATQEVFVRSSRQRHLLRRMDDPRRWLLRVAHNYCLNQLRDQRRRGELLLLFENSEDHDASAALAARDVADVLTRGVPDQVRRVVWLTYVDDMQQEQVAQALGISRRTVVNRIATFRATIQRTLKRMNGGQDGRGARRAAASVPPI